MSEERLAEREEQRTLERLPEWVPQYLAAWGSTRPDGKAMSVEWAAGLAGVTPSGVRSLRERRVEFRRLEYLTRHGTAAFMASYAEAGLRGSAPAILNSFLALIQEREYHTVIQGMKWLMNKPDVSLEGPVVEFNLQDWMTQRESRRAAVAALTDGEGGNHEGLPVQGG